MDWIKKNWIIVLLAACLLGAVCGLLYTGYNLFEAKNLIKRITRDINSANGIIVQQQSDIGKLKSDIDGSRIEIEQLAKDKRILSENNSQLTRNNGELTKSVESSKGKLKEIVGIIGTAVHH